MCIFMQVLRIMWKKASFLTSRKYAASRTLLLSLLLYKKNMNIYACFRIYKIYTYKHNTIVDLLGTFYVHTTLISARTLSLATGSLLGAPPLPNYTSKSTAFANADLTPATLAPRS